MDPSFVTPGVAARPRTPAALFGAALRRPGGRRALSVLSVALAFAGVGMFAFPAYTDLVAHWRQNHLRAQFESPQFAEEYRLHEIKIGDGLTRLISKQDMETDVIVVQGTTPSALKAGAGHYPETPLPCEAGNVGIAGHRTTYSRPFNKIDEMKQGDVVTLITPFQQCDYTVIGAFDGHPNPYVVSPDDFTVVDPPTDPKAHWLTLTSCHPKGSAAQRIVLRLVLTHVENLKPASESSNS